ncbi:hypothetical protein ED733_003153 [Metarhizium rileyi]|uniref:Hydrophobic surface binding protein n=1 Tax=Metarhizium rileyi (strain RCEF 4871) TaxID=1649241 RepID=A0A5C6GDU0_METRR|nr:hypothetical protein ED733_003153 [Metarhizium rileyi]
MLSIKNILFLAVAATGSVVKRDVAQVKQGLQTINADTVAVTNAVNNYHGGGYDNAMPIVTAQEKLSDDSKEATSAVEGTNSVSHADANDIFAFIDNTLKETIEDSINALKSKREYFKADQLEDIVKSTLQSLQSDTDKLSDALLAKTPADLADKAKNIQARIYADFKDAITYFSS